MKDGPIPPDFFGIVPLFAPSASDAQQMSQPEWSPCGCFPTGGSWSRSPGVYNWAPADAVIQNVAAAGLTPAVQFASSPGWIAPSNPNSPPIYSSPQIAAWQQFLANFVRRYGAHGSFWAAHPNLPYHPVSSYEIWNEPNLRLIWGGPPNARDYLRLLKVSTPVIRATTRAPRSSSAGSSPSPGPSTG